MVASIVVTVVAFVATPFIPWTWLSLLTASLGSAALSVFLALLITEFLIKPLYVRDVINVARLSAEVHDSGLVKMGRLNNMDVSEDLNGATEVDISGLPMAVDRIWPHVIEAATTSSGKVRLFLPKGTDTSKCRDYEQAWKRSGCEAKGAILELTPAAENHPLLTVITQSRCIVAVEDGRGASGNPLVMIFARGRPEPYVSSLVSRMHAFRDSEIAPNYVTSEKM
jgi:hypothetical protein